MKVAHVSSIRKHDDLILEPLGCGFAKGEQQLTASFFSLLGSTHKTHPRPSLCALGSRLC